MRPPSEHSESRSAAELCEDVVSTYIQNCLSTWERRDVAAIFFISVGAPLGPDLGGAPVPLLYILLEVIHTYKKYNAKVTEVINLFMPRGLYLCLIDSTTITLWTGLFLIAGCLVSFIMTMTRLRFVIVALPGLFSYLFL